MMATFQPDLARADDGCQWSYCAGTTISGQTTCDEYGLRYSGRIDGRDCAVFKEKVECCSYEGRKTDPGYAIKISECEWSYCAGATIGGQTTCDEYGKRYTGSYSGADCAFSKSQVQCCKYEKVLTNDCKRTYTCYGMNYGADWACGNDYGSGYHAALDNDGKEACSSSFTWSYKCCKP